MNEDDFSLFRGEMKDVEPHSPTHGLLRKRPPPAFETSLEAKRKAAVSDRKADPNYLTSEHIVIMSPHDVLGWKKAGVQDGVYRKLRLGKYVIEASLDLHRLTVAQAREQVFKFIYEAQKRNLRTVLVTHGKGERSEKPARIKSFVNCWLQQLAPVLAFHSTLPKHGGTGSVYVLIQKSEDSKLIAREQFNAR